MFTRAQDRLIKKLEQGSIAYKDLSNEEQRVEDSLRERGCVQSMFDAKTGEHRIGLIPDHVEMEREFG